MALPRAMAKRAGGPSGCTDSLVHKRGPEQSTSAVPIKAGLVPSEGAKTPGDSSRARAHFMQRHSAAGPVLRVSRKPSLQSRVWQQALCSGSRAPACSQGYGSVSLIITDRLETSSQLTSGKPAATNTTYVQTGPMVAVFATKSQEREQNDAGLWRLPAHTLACLDHARPA